MKREELLAELELEKAALKLKEEASRIQIEQIKPGMSQIDYERACADILAALREGN